MPESNQASSVVMVPRYVPRHSTQCRSADSDAYPGRPMGRSSVRLSCVPALGFATCALMVFVAAFGLIWIYVAMMPMAFLGHDYSLWVAKRTILEECRLGPVAVFGDSRTMAAVYPGLISGPVTNLALSGATPLETYFAVQRALRCETPLKLIVISHGALKFMSDPDYWAFDAKAGFLNYAEMRAVDGDAARLHDTEIEDMRRGDKIPPMLREALFTYRFPPFYFDSLVHGVVALRWHRNRRTLRDSLSSSGHALYGTDSGSSYPASETEISRYKVSPLVDLYFSRTLALLAEHRIPVVFLSMPVNHATYVQIRPEFRDGFAAYLQDKARQYPGLHVVGPAIPCWPDQFFGDAFHFNARGAEAYSRAFDRWLSPVLAGGSPGELPGRCTSAE
jgi:hypothetical protein